MLVLIKGVTVSMNQSVAKALSILFLFTEDEELTLQQITEKTNIPKATAYRLLTTLENHGIVYNVKASTHDSRYGLGLKLLELGNLVAERIELRKVARPFMEKLAEDINEVVHLVIKNQDKATYIERVNSNRALSLYTKIGRSVPLYVGSGPKMLLAFQSDEEIEKVLNQSPLMTFNDKIIERETLRNELNEIRNIYYSISISEQDADTTGISFPIFNFENNVVAALAISGLSSRFKGSRLEEMKVKGKETALSISKELGYLGNFPQ